MATDGDTKLTKHKSTVTVVTADFANSIFGGLYGSGDGDSLADDDPRVRGHVHDGQRGDGHGPKVHLVDHVTDQLINKNLADDAVMKRNVYDGIHVNAAIPEYEDRGGTRFYYLDLRHVRADFVFQEDESPGFGQHKLIRQRSQDWDDTLVDINGDPDPDYVDIPDVWATNEGFDFVVGSSSLDDLNSGGDGDSRLQFDKSQSAFRAGRVDGGQWDEVNRGGDSVALGHNVAATAERSTVSGGSENKAEASGSTVAGGHSNVATGIHSSISGGDGNMATSEVASIGGGLSNRAEASGSTVAGGVSNKAQGNRSFVGGGYENFAIGKESAVAGGHDNEAGGKHATVGGGSSNSAGAEGSTVSGGGGTTGNLISAVSSWATIGGGFQNEIEGAGSSVSGGKGNIIVGDASTVSGGEGNHITGELSTICGGGGADKNTITSKGSSITGGSLNTIGSDYSAILGGYDNIIEPNAKYGAIVGGLSNKIEGDHSVIIGGYGAHVSGLSSVSIGGSSSKIVGSSGSITVGSGKELEPLTVGYEYVSTNNVPVPSSPSPMSGVVGGYSNHIVGGMTADKAENNFLVGGSGNKLGAIEAYVSNSQIFGGFGNEVAAYASQVGLGHIDHGLIVGGEQNFILMGQASSHILSSGIIGGFQNSINWIPHKGDAFGNIFTPMTHSIAPWFRPSSYGINSFDGSPGQPEAGVQTSYIFGGVKNSISNSRGASFGDESLCSATLGGHSNVISSGHGSSILGGGAFVNTLGGSAERPPYDTHSEYYANVIQGGHHSSILNGSSNLIKQYTFPFNSAGPIWSTNENGDALGEGTNTGVYGKDLLPEPLFCVAEGRESYSYLYGQHAHASGGHDKDVFRVAQDFSSASIHHNPASPGLPTPSSSDYMVQLGSEADGKGDTLNQPGSAQTSALDFFGSWTYNKDEIPSAHWVDGNSDGEPDWTAGDDWRPAAWNSLNAVSATNTPWFEFRSYLGGGRDDINDATYGPNRCFIPRYPASYQFAINGALSFTSMNKGHGTSYGGKYGIGFHEVISFTYTGYIVMQPDGGGKYGGVLSNVMSSDGRTPAQALTLFDPSIIGNNGLTGSNFSIGFCPHWLIGPGGTGEVIWPGNAYQASVGAVVGTSCSGSWYEPSSGLHGADHLGVTSWPPKFSLYVVNNTGSPTALGGGNGTGELLIGESLVARAEVSENLLFLGRYNPSTPSWTQP